ncbi:MAG: hypothetical protein DRQ49_07660 [Gammaproteobacteria bacterium]|nr:MAG: hypothetical protein DRQ49_07660 [Gammaproteobacteria bacterium]RKZ76195.1 MAG: hypothetical protein DRQ57_04745 [Gammaproteobacteria bacterium]
MGFLTSLRSLKGRTLIFAPTNKITFCKGRPPRLPFVKLFILNALEIGENLDPMFFEKTWVLANFIFTKLKGEPYI